MEPYLQVPVSVARDIAERFSKSQVVILCYDADHEMTHTTTFGRSAFDKENAAAVGEKLAQAVGGDLGRKQVFEDFHTDCSAAQFKEAVDLLQTIARRNGTTPQMIQQVERFLKTCGHTIRQA